MFPSCQKEGQPATCLLEIAPRLFLHFSPSPLCLSNTIRESKPMLPTPHTGGLGLGQRACVPGLLLVSF